MRFLVSSLADPVRLYPMNGDVMPTAATRFPDVNGDGLADAVIGTDRGLHVFVGRGDGTFEAPRFVRYPESLEGVDFDRVRFGDMNRDGLTDLSLVSPGSVRMYAGVPGDALFDPDFRELPGPEDSDENAVVALADANGNGSLDFVWSSSEGMWLLDLAGPATAGMLTAVQNGMGKDVTFRYAASATLARDAAAEGNPWRVHMPVSIPVVVERTMRASQQGLARTVEYEFRDAFWDGSENSFGGFLSATVKTRDLEGNIDSLVSTRFHPGSGNMRVLRGRPVIVEELDADGSLRTRALNYWHALAPAGLDDGDRLLRKPMLDQTLTRHYEVLPGDPETVTQTRIRYEHDEQGRVILEANDGRLDLTGDEVLLTRQYADNWEDWILNRVCEEKLSSGDGSNVVTHTRAYFGSGDTALPHCEVGRGFEMRTDALLTETDADGNPEERWVTLVERTYDDDGNAVEIEEKGVLRKIAYDDYGIHPVSESVRSDEDTLLTWTADWDDVLGVMKTSTDASGVTTHMTYDALGRLTAVSVGDAAPHIRYEYDWERDFPRTHTFRFDREHGDPQMAVVPTSGSWDPDTGWRHEVQILNGNREPRLSAVALEPQRWIVSDFQVRDHAGRAYFTAKPFTIDDAALDEALVEHIEPGADGSLGTADDGSSPPARDGSRMEYDAAGRIVRTQLPQGTVQLTEYGAFRVRTSTEDFSDVVLTQDGQGRTIRSERVVNGVTESVDTTYSPAGHITELSINDGAVLSSFAYDQLGRLVFADDPDIGERKLVYNDAGQLLSHENGEGQMVEYSYDLAGRLTGIDHDGVPHARYYYDEDATGSSAGHLRGRLAWAEEDFQPAFAGYLPSGEASFSYDRLGRRVGHTRTIRGKTMSESMVLSASGLELGRSFDDGFAYTHEYDAAGRLVSIPGVWTADALAPDGSVELETYANGVVRQVSRDAGGLPETVSISRADETLYDVVATRGSSGSIVTLSDDDGRGLNHSGSFEYDLGGRLTSAKLGALEAADAWDYEFSYTYDALQNMTSRKATRAGQVLVAGEYRYGERGTGPRQLSSIQGPETITPFDHDLAGRQILAGVEGYIFNAADQLVEVSSKKAGAMRSYRYGHDGQRILALSGGAVDETWFSGSVVQRGDQREHYIAVGDRLVAPLHGRPRGCFRRVGSGTETRGSFCLVWPHEL